MLADAVDSTIGKIDDGANSDVIIDDGANDDVDNVYNDVNDNNYDDLTDGGWSTICSLSFDNDTGDDDTNHLFRAICDCSGASLDGVSIDTGDGDDDAVAVADADDNVIGSITGYLINADTNGDVRILLLCIRSFNNNDSLSGGNNNERGTSIDTTLLDKTSIESDTDDKGLFDGDNNNGSNSGAFLGNSSIDTGVGADADNRIMLPSFSSLTRSSLQILFVFLRYTDNAFLKDLSSSCFSLSRSRPLQRNESGASVNSDD